MACFFGYLAFQAASSCFVCLFVCAGWGGGGRRLDWQPQSSRPNPWTQGSAVFMSVSSMVVLVHPFCSQLVRGEAQQSTKKLYVIGPGIYMTHSGLLISWPLLRKSLRKLCVLGEGFCKGLGRSRGTVDQNNLHHPVFTTIPQFLGILKHKGM